MACIHKLLSLLALAFLATVQSQASSGYTEIHYGDKDYNLAVATGKVAYELKKDGNKDLAGLSYCRVQEVEKKTTPNKVTLRVNTVVGKPIGVNETFPIPCTREFLFTSVVDWDLAKEFNAYSSYTPIRVQVFK